MSRFDEITIKQDDKTTQQLLIDVVNVGLLIVLHLEKVTNEEFDLSDIKDIEKE